MPQGEDTIDTIVAISTPPGRGGIGIVRLSGPAARTIPAAILRLRGPLEPQRARLAELLDERGEVIDEGVVTFFAGPHSYTSEDVVEIAVHGSPVLLEYIVTACIGGGARLAEPGEFTQRAFLSGRLDLTQAEAVNDLIASQTLAQARVAAAQLGGSLSRAVAPIKRALVELIAALEAGIDFAEDDPDLLPQEEIAARIDELAAPLASLASTYATGRILREGISLAIVGRPNAGKSSLFNRLLERERAIVTAQPGTTRDAITERVSLGGIPVELIDTAGLRVAESEAEEQGIERTRATLAEADVVLLVIDAATLTPAPDLDDGSTLASLKGRPHLVVLNKSDLVEPPLAAEGMLVSATTGAGIEALRLEIVTLVTRSTGLGDSALVTNLRQHRALMEACDALGAGGRAARGKLPHEMLLLDLYTALSALDSLTGATAQDDVLNLIFARFCIGK